MDAEDEPAMAYFLPNGIADDVPFEKRCIKTSFGPIGGRGNSISSSTDHFRFGGPFGSELGDKGSTRDARAIRSPTSIFEQEQEAPKDFSMHVEGRKSCGTTGSFGTGTQLLYRGGNTSSYLSGGDHTFRSSSMRAWPSSVTEVSSQPRRVLQCPPGLAGPPGLSELLKVNEAQSRMGIGRVHEDVIQQRATGSQYGPVHHSALSASRRASNTALSSSNDQFGPRLLSNLSLTTDVFEDSSLRSHASSHTVSSSDLIELKTHSAEMREIDSTRVRRAVNNREATTSRRVDIRASSKTPRSPETVLDWRKKPENQLSNLRAKALESSMYADNDFASKSFDRDRRMAPLTNLYGSLPSSIASNRKSYDSSVPRGKRRNQVDDKDARSASLSTGGKEIRRRGTASQSEEPSALVSLLTVLEGSESSAKTPLRELGKSKHREGDPKTSSRSTCRRNSARGNDRGTGITRRQVYREKPLKENVKGLCVPASILACSSAHKRQSSNDGPMAKVNSQKREENVAQDDHSIAFTKASDDGKEMSKSIKAKADDIDETARESTKTSTVKSIVSARDGDAARPAGDNRSCHKESTLSRSTERELFKPRELSEHVVNEPNPPDPSQAAVADKRYPSKERRKEKCKKEKADKKRTTRGKRGKRGVSLTSKTADTVHNSAAEAQSELLEALATKSIPLPARIVQVLCYGCSIATKCGFLACSWVRYGCVWAAGRLNVKGPLAITISSAESVFKMLFSVLLLLSLHAVSWFIRIHRVAFRAILIHRHIGFCFAFLYGFPFLVQYVLPWAPPWAPVCLWYAFLAQLFCTNGSTAMVTTFRVLLPLVFLVEGISHHSFLLDLNGAELLLTSFIISALKTSNLCSSIFFLSLATQCLLAVFLGSELIVQWLQLTLALHSLHITAATDDKMVRNRLAAD